MPLNTPASGKANPMLSFEEIILPKTKLTVLKTYGDFKRLY
jgi:hypothetical protein